MKHPYGLENARQISEQLKKDGDGEMTKERALQMADEWNQEAEEHLASDDGDRNASGLALERCADRLREQYGEFPRTDALGNWRRDLKARGA